MTPWRSRCRAYICTSSRDDVQIWLTLAAAVLGGLMISALMPDDIGLAATARTIRRLLRRKRLGLWALVVFVFRWF